MNATDTHTVSSISITGVDAASSGHEFGTSPLARLPTDFRGNVTFTATNMFGLTSSCTVSMTTFTTQLSWQRDDMSVTGGSNVTAVTPNGSGPVYYVNSTYPVWGAKQQLAVSNGNLFENYYGKASEIVFEVTVTPQVEGLVYIDQQSGDIIISATNAHLVNKSTTNYTVELRGRDTEGAVAVVNRWPFAVQIRPAFKVLVYARSSQPTSGAEPVMNMTFRAESPFAAGEAFRLAEVDLTEVVHADPSRCTFTLKGNASTAGLFINPATGAIQGLIDTAGLYRMILVAQAEHGAEYTLEDVVLDVRKTDVSVEAYGPGGKGCGENGQAVDNPASRFDKTFTCDCDGTIYGGDNCEIEKAEVGPGADSGVVVGVVLGLIIVLIFIAAARWKYQAHAKANAPADFGAEIQVMVENGDLDAEEAALVAMPRELHRSWLTMTDRVGAGNFGKSLVLFELPPSVPELVCICSKLYAGFAPCRANERRFKLPCLACECCRRGLESVAVRCRAQRRARISCGL